MMVSLGRFLIPWSKWIDNERKIVNIQFLVKVSKTTVILSASADSVEASIVINDPKCNKGPKCNNFWP